MGHLMRMLVLADEAVAQGWSVIVLTHPEDRESLKQIDHPCVNRTVDLSSEEAKQWLSDHYSVSDTAILLDLVEDDYREFRFLKEWGWTVATLTLFDFGDEDRYEDLTIFPDYSEHEVKSVDGPYGKTLCCSGKPYLLVRNCFFELPGDKNFEGVRIIVTMGGSDPMRITEQVIRALKGVNMLDISIVLGLTNPHRPELVAMMPQEWNVLEHGKFDFASELKKSTLAIINGGVTRYECVAARTPFAAISLHDYQYGVTENLVADGFGFNLGVYNELTDGDLRVAISAIVEDSERLLQMQDSAPKLITGNGTHAILNAINFLHTIEQQ